MWIQLNLLLGYADGAGNESRPSVVYANSDAEKGSDGGRLAGNGPSCGTGELCWNVGDWPWGSLRSRITCVMVGWNGPPYFECASRRTGNVLPYVKNAETKPDCLV